MIKHRREKPAISNEEMRDLILNEEPYANTMVANILIFVAACFFATWLLFKVGTFDTADNFENYVFLPGSVIMLAACIVCHLKNGKERWLKYVLFSLLVLAVLAANIATGYKTWMFYAIPLILSCHYSNALFTTVVCLVTVCAAVAACLCNALFAYSIGIIDLNTAYYSHHVILETSESLYLPALMAGVDTNRVLDATLKLVLLPNLLTIICATIISIGVIKNGQRLMAVAAENAHARASIEAEMERGRSKLMVSQIQPHFLYNTLSAIMAIDGNPDETVDALGTFGKYLRENLDSLSSENPIPFEHEMRHVKRYVALEQLRFKEKVAVSYELNAVDFAIPALTVQVLVENAVKHGISKIAKGGTVTIVSEETPSEWIVTVRDDGTGFDTSAPIDESKHVGLANVRTRLNMMCKGTLLVESAPGKGCLATVNIPKEQGQEEDR